MMLLSEQYPFVRFPLLLRDTLPSARAILTGAPSMPALQGQVDFYQTDAGVLGEAFFYGLPEENECAGGIFAMHIHEGSRCSGNSEDPFADAGAHFNPGDCPHPYHAGDLPPIFAAGQTGYGSFLTRRFTVEEILGRTVILHSRPDDFTTQPSGNAGAKIACGMIEKL